MIGKILGERYEIMEKIGGGGMAEVYKAKCKLLNRFVAVKVLRDQFINDDEVMSKFKREAQSAASLSHPNIVNVYDVGVQGNINYIVMEYIDGKTLKDVIKEKGRLETEEVVRISTDIAEALKAAHLNGIVHRDIKPHNIMITKDNRVKVTDFGIARAATSSTITNTGSILGSAHYISPEQARGGFVDMKSDIYSLGVVMYEMTTGQLPYNGDSPITVAIKHIQEEPKDPSEVEPSVSKELEAIIKKAMTKDQSMRYANTTELLMDLKKVGGAGVSGGASSETMNSDIMDSRTQILPVIDEEKLEQSKAGKEVKKKAAVPKKPKEKPKYSKKVTALAVILSLLLVSTVAMGYLYSKGMFGGGEVAVPSVVGMTESEATRELENAGLVIKVKGAEFSDEYEEGQVTRQSPEEGLNLKEGATVDVYLSKGPEVEEILVPSLLGESLERAKSIIEENELELGDVLYEYSPESEGTVISQTPRANKNVEKGATVDLIVSKGEELSEVSVPNLAGLSLENAKNRLSASGLSVGSVSEEFSNRSAGTVLFQGIESGAKVEEGTSVNLVVSKGPEPKPEEPEEDPGESGAGEGTGGESGAGEGTGSEETDPGTGTENPTSPNSEGASGN
ncbi:serine/threonine-protein kinase PrkC [Andreesenia angusta]|uniref:non-specific serine/threonine protein kinase n=1 Tax=Andreesenia angusta TaxID=39480 RepID=A0A1S1V8B7_9FIRM|nr:Stk1 family PASTA domain-containing Ser/Thr kinase [Andreesenia angusta]OHW62645.1 serine/threonine-protein kinase PrkC [Andreesenia angusta]